MKRTALSSLHESLGAKMVPFAGFYMPVEYSGITTEHITVREKLGVFDVSHMGEFYVRGPKSFEFIQKLTTNDLAAIGDGKVQYTCFPNGEGGIVDDLLVYRISSEEYLLVVNAGNLDKDWNWCCKHAEIMGLEIGKELVNESDNISQLAVQGPLAMKAMQKLTKAPVEDMEFYTFKIIDFAGIPDVVFATTGYTGSGGCEIYVKNEYAEKLWNAVFEAGEEFGVKPIGLGARDTLRLEKGYCLYGNDIDMTTSPIEAGLGWITKFVDGNDFIDRERFFNQKTNGVARKLTGFVMAERAIPRQHYKVADAEGNTIGEVTSGTMSPMMKQGIGMAYLLPEYSKPGSEIFIEIRAKLVKAVTVKQPIYNG